MRFDNSKACKKLPELWRVPFDLRKTCRRLAPPKSVYEFYGALDVAFCHPESV